jgi:hypothetical protein
MSVLFKGLLLFEKRCIFFHLPAMTVPVIVFVLFSIPASLLSKVQPVTTAAEARREYRSFAESTHIPSLALGRGLESC